MKQTRIKVTYLAIDSDNNPLTTAGSFNDLRLSLDDYFGVGGKDQTAKCLGFKPYESKYGDTYEGYYEYQFDFNGIQTEKVKVYCLDFFPLTKYEIEI